MINAFNNVDALTFATYIEDIRQQLATVASDWHIHMHNMGDADGPKLFYQLARIDFSKGKDHKPAVPLAQWVFAYETIHPHAYFLFNQSPIGERQ